VIWLAVIGLSVLGSAGGMATAGLLVALHRDVRSKVVPWLVSYAVGTLLGAALLSVLPEALETLPPARAFGTMLGAILTFFALEKLVLWRHCHDDHDCETHHHGTASMVVIGDAVHTFVDGAVIAATAMVSLPLGLTTALAVTAHEIPQQAGDVAILLTAGHSPRRAWALTAAAAGGGIAGAIAMLVFGANVPGVLPYALAFAAGNFLYVAMSDLIPHLHRGGIDTNAVRQIVLIALGIATMVLL
jgi:zinc and cadmium transporter